MENNIPKQMTLDDLAVMVADGFSDLGGRIDKIDGRLDKVEGHLGGLEGRMDKLEGRMDGLENRMGTLENSMTGLRSSVNNYLDLSDKRYLELKHRDALIANWLKAVADKTGVPIDIGQLEKII